jgi:UPF0755 protein
MAANRKLIIFAISIIIDIFIFVQVYNFWLNPVPKDAPMIDIAIEEGSGASTISTQLKEEGIIKNVFWFKVFLKIDGRSSALQAGEFSVAKGASYSRTVDTLTVGSSKGEVTLTIPEGLNLDQIGELVTQSFSITAEEWDDMVGPDSSLENHAFIVQAQKPDRNDLEGYLFPDTYRFFPEATAEEIVRELVDTMELRVETLEGDLPSSWTWHEALTLASIIQREVLFSSEMKNIGDIFLKRLEIGMALQADSTVNYITGNDTPSISLDDRAIDSLYNTYQYPGLPPGPISSPGTGAIDAVLNPTTNSYYFFLTTPEGEVKYANTYDQHLQNKTLHLN